MKAIITIGVSGSGKTTWAESQKDTQIVCRDNVRRHILWLEDKIEHKDNLWSKWNFKREKEVTDIYWKTVHDMASSRHNIILADTNLNPGRRQEMKARLESLGYEVEFKQFDIDYETAVKRDLNRRDSVGASVIWKQYKELYGEVYVPPKDAPKAVIFDVDGTLAIKSNRSPFEWHRVGEDTVDACVADILRDYYNNGVKVIIVSGRDSVCRGETESWFADNNILYHEFYMRAEGDMRKDFVVKREIYEAHIRNKFNVICAFDDRPSILRLWLLLGIKVFSVADPYIEF